MRVVIICCLLLFTAPAAALADSDSAGNSDPAPGSTTQTGTTPDDDAQPAPIHLSPKRAADAETPSSVADTTADQDDPKPIDYSFTIEWAYVNVGFDIGERVSARADLGLITVNYHFLSWTLAEVHPTLFIGPLGGSTRLAARSPLKPAFERELRIGGLFTANLRWFDCKSTSNFLFGPTIQFINNMPWGTLGAGLDVQYIGWQGQPASTEACGDEYSPRYATPLVVALYVRVGFFKPGHPKVNDGN